MIPIYMKQEPASLTSDVRSGGGVEATCDLHSSGGRVEVTSDLHSSGGRVEMAGDVKQARENKLLTILQPKPLLSLQLQTPENNYTEPLHF